MPRKFPWLKLCIILFSISSIWLLFIPYPERKVLDKGYPTHAFYLSKSNSFSVRRVKFPWRSYYQEIYLNISASPQAISFEIMNANQLSYYLDGGPYIPYLKIDNITELATTIILTSPLVGYRYFIFYIDTDDIAEEDRIKCYTEVRVWYLRYASSYGFFFLGVVILLISSYGYRKYKWRNKTIS